MLTADRGYGQAGRRPSPPPARQPGARRQETTGEKRGLAEQRSTGDSEVPDRPRRQARQGDSPAGRSPGYRAAARRYGP